MYSTGSPPRSPPPIIELRPPTPAAGGRNSLIPIRHRVCGRLLMWGRNNNGQVGQGDTGRPREVRPRDVMALKGEGVLWVVCALALVAGTGPPKILGGRAAAQPPPRSRGLVAGGAGPFHRSFGGTQFMPASVRRWGAQGTWVRAGNARDRARGVAV